MNPSVNIVKVAMAASGARTQIEFGQMLGKSKAAVGKYVKQGKFPISVVLQVEELSGIRRDMLAPEFFNGYVLAERSADIPRHRLAPELFAGYAAVGPRANNDLVHNHDISRRSGGLTVYEKKTTTPQGKPQEEQP